MTVFTWNKTKSMSCIKRGFQGFHIDLSISPRDGEWAVPGGTARPGQPVEKSEQAPASFPRFKNQFNIDGPQWGPYQILS